MLRQAWNAYRDWAKLARDLQTETQRWRCSPPDNSALASSGGAASAHFPYAARGSLVLR